MNKPLLMGHTGRRGGPLVRVVNAEKLIIEGLPEGSGIDVYVYKEVNAVPLNSPEPPQFFGENGEHDFKLSHGWVQVTRKPPFDNELNVTVVTK